MFNVPDMKGFAQFLGAFWVGDSDNVLSQIRCRVMVVVVIAVVVVVVVIFQQDIVILQDSISRFGRLIQS